MYGAILYLYFCVLFLSQEEQQAQQAPLEGAIAPHVEAAQLAAEGDMPIEEIMQRYYPDALSKMQAELADRAAAADKDNKDKSQSSAAGDGKTYTHSTHSRTHSLKHSLKRSWRTAPLLLPTKTISTSRS